MINNILNKEYVSNGYYYTYDDTWSDPNSIITIEGTGYYPQAKRNFYWELLLNFKTRYKKNISRLFYPIWF